MEVQIFVSLAVVLATALIALIVDYLKGNNENLREHNIELRARQAERDRMAARGWAQPQARTTHRHRANRKAEEAAAQAPETAPEPAVPAPRTTVVNANLSPGSAMTVSLFVDPQPVADAAPAPVEVWPKSADLVEAKALPPANEIKITAAEVEPVAVVVPAPVPEAVVEVVPEPAVAAEAAVEPVAEPVAQADAEPVAQVDAAPVAEAAVEAVVEPVAEPVVAQAVAEIPVAAEAPVQAKEAESAPVAEAEPVLTVVETQSEPEPGETIITIRAVDSPAEVPAISRPLAVSHEPEPAVEPVRMAEAVPVEAPVPKDAPIPAPAPVLAAPVAAEAPSAVVTPLPATIESPEPRVEMAPPVAAALQDLVCKAIPEIQPLRPLEPKPKAAAPVDIPAAAPSDIKVDAPSEIDATPAPRAESAPAPEAVIEIVAETPLPAEPVAEAPVAESNEIQFPTPPLCERVYNLVPPAQRPMPLPAFRSLAASPETVASASVEMPGRSGLAIPAPTFSAPVETNLVQPPPKSFIVDANPCAADDAEPAWTDSRRDPARELRSQLAAMLPAPAECNEPAADPPGLFLVDRGPEPVALPQSAPVATASAFASQEPAMPRLSEYAEAPALPEPAAEIAPEAEVEAALPEPTPFPAPVSEAPAADDRDVPYVNGQPWRESPVTTFFAPPAAPPPAPVEPEKFILPPGMHSKPELDAMLNNRTPIDGIVVAVAINDFPSNSSVAESIIRSVTGLMESMAEKTGFTARRADDEFVLVFQDVSGNRAQRLLAEISERLWDYQLRSLGTNPITFAWGTVEVLGESLRDAVGAACERMYQTKRTRSGPLVNWRQRRQAVNL